jgi:hypothetical protein
MGCVHSKEQQINTIDLGYRHPPTSTATHVNESQSYPKNVQVPINPLPSNVQDESNDTRFKSNHFIQTAKYFLKCRNELNKAWSSLSTGTFHFLI